jgi:hypothetical protein
MDPSETLVIEEVLRSQLGSSARIRMYDRTIDSPMNFVLARAEEQLRTSFAVYWVDDSAPEMFSLRGFSVPVAVFTSRYVELWADIRGAVSSDMLRNVLPEVTERLALQLMAELSLSHNDPEFAASMILRSLTTDSGIYQLPNTIASLELEPIGVPYMGAWFYGLSHELGHFTSSDPDRQSGGTMDSAIALAVDETLDGWNLPDSLRAEGRSRARAKPKLDILGAEHLRGEIHADLFAASVLFQSTVDILKRGSFQILAFISEMILSLNIIAIVDHCRRTVRHAVTATPQREHVLDTLFHPVALAVRLKWVRQYLQVATAQYLFGDRPSQEEREKVSAGIDSVMEHLRPVIEGSEKGMSAALNVALDRQRRGSFFDILEKWLVTARKQPGNLAQDRFAIERFCALAASLGRTSPIFSALLEAAQNPSAPFRTTLTGEEVRAYFCPWVSGPNEFSRPFGLDTRYGHIVFVFLSDSELLKKFCDASKESLAEGYTMGSTLIGVKTIKQLVEAITLRVPVGTNPLVVVQGTDEFDRYIKELMEDTIWPEDLPRERQQ